MRYKEVIARNNPSQSHWELNEVLKVLEDIEIKNILEIGVHRGGSLNLWKEVFKPKVLIGINQTNELDFPVTDFLFIEGDSHDPQTLDKVKAAMYPLNEKNMFDFLFIDGDHLYKGVKKDFEMYSPLIRPGGVVVFHDVILQGNDTCEVYKFWEELQTKYKTLTFWDGTPSGTGEGILFL